MRKTARASRSTLGRAKEDELILSLCHEMGWDLRDKKATIERFRGVFPRADIRDAARGDAITLKMLRAECGLDF